MEILELLLLLKMTPEELTEEKFVSNQQKYKEELEKLEQKYNGMLNPKDVVREASNLKSPLHNWFDWNDDEAGEKWRLHQARILINHIKVTIIFNGTEKQYKKYLNVRVNGEDSRMYVSAENVSRNPNMREQILQKALMEAEYWRRTYEDYKELEDIFKSVDKTKKKLKKKLSLYPRQ